jgi:hypothetical protein
MARPRVPVPAYLHVEARKSVSGVCQGIAVTVRALRTQQSQQRREWGPKHRARVGHSTCGHQHRTLHVQQECSGAR